VLALRFDEAAAGRGGAVLVSGEAGVGKTAVVTHVLAAGGAAVLRDGGYEHAAAPYAPLVTILRAHERRRPGALAGSGPLSRQLAALFPELGPEPPMAGTAVVEALLDAVRQVGAGGPAVIVLDDLHVADTATLEFLPSLAVALRDLWVLVVGVYRSDEITRDHPVRALRAELRRARALEEVTLGALGFEDTVALAARVLGRTPGPALAAALVDRTEGIPFFVEELTAALSVSGRLRETGGVVELAGDDVPLPRNVRDAVRLRTDRLSMVARRALELAAVAGGPVDLGLIADVHGDTAADEALEAGVLVEHASGVARFRHALVRDAIYADIPWTRRRALHRRIAEALAAAGGTSAEIAGHWVRAHDHERARPLLLEAATAFCAVHAYRDAAAAARLALETWPSAAEADPGRVGALERLAHCAELSGESGEAARVWEEVADAHEAGADWSGCGEASRRLACVHVLHGSPQRARAARERAADAFDAAGRATDAAAERLAIAEALELAGGGAAALQLVASTAVALTDADPDLRIRALALEGELRAKQGDRDAGVGCVREALAMALEQGGTGATAEAYYRLGAVLENSCDHAGAVTAYSAARDYCGDRGIDGLAQVCFACMLPAVFLTGDWERTVEVARGVLQSAASPPIARAKGATHLGLVRVLRGDSRRARALLEDGLSFGRTNEIFPIELFATWGLSRAHAAEGAEDVAAELLGGLLERCADRQEHHYSVPVLRWASTLFAGRGDKPAVGACLELLARTAAATGHPECLGPFAHALGERALLDGDPVAAAAHFDRAAALLAEAGTPYERAEVQLRAAAAHSAAGRHEEAVRRLVDAHRAARRLAARPLAMQAADALRASGEPVERRLGRRAAAELDAGGLSRREDEVLRLAADGLTNREIALRLIVSKRTVDMHMRNVFTKLGCRTRTQAAARARELHLLA
jgi:DNA-binding CsgD family transcriptional regulator